jgi:HTH-type transcriptional regulator / antitoxin HipB
LIFCRFGGKFYKIFKSQGKNFLFNTEFTAMAARIPSDNPSRIAEAILFHRKQSGLSRIDLAEIAGVGKTVIYDIEHGKDSVRLNTLLKVMKALNIAFVMVSPLMEAFERRNHEAG